MCNIIFSHQLGAEKSEIRAGLEIPGSNFCCITSKQNNYPFHNLYGCKFLKITFKICSQFSPHPTSTHTWSSTQRYLVTVQKIWCRTNPDWITLLSYQSLTLRKKWGFPSSISSVNMVHFAENCEFDHISRGNS